MADYHPPGVTSAMTGEDDVPLTCRNCTYRDFDAGEPPCMDCDDFSAFKDRNPEGL